MTITRESVRKMLNIDSNKIPDLVKSGQLTVVKTRWNSKQFFDRSEVLKLSKKLKQPKEL